ncbi:MAG: outer membrane beta-barrel protein [Bacteroidales bacterium]|jgi:hypothetical protein|nr:outer membrane beta-barrel protein [Bacteroidales bacterium]
MKKFFTAVLAGAMMLIGTSAFAQASLGAGYVYGKTNIDVNILSLLTKEVDASLNGFYLGGSYNIPVGTSGLGIAPGLYFSYLTKDNANLAVAEGDLTETYFTAPIDLNLGVPVGDGLRFIVFGGPTLSYGLTSKVAVPVSGDSKHTYDIYDGELSNWTKYKNFDVMVGGGVGLDFENMVRFTVGYDYGLLNRGGSTVNVHRQQLHAGVAFLF